ncbi:MAG: DUF6588 family protein, partial [bacterium]
ETNNNNINFSRRRFMIALKLKTIAVIFAMLLPLSTSAADENFGETMQKIGEDAIQGYFGPFVTLMGTGMNSGWYNSSKSYKLFGLPVGLSVATITIPLVSIDDDFRYFDFSGELPMAPVMDPFIKTQFNGATWDEFANQLSTTVGAATGNTISVPDKIKFAADSVPTIFGPKIQRKLTIAEFLRQTDTSLTNLLFKDLTVAVAIPGTTGTVTIPIAQAPLDSTQEVTLPFLGLNVPDLMPAVPTLINLTALTVGVKKIPVINNLQIGLRIIPEIGGGELGSVGQLGIKVQNEFTHLIPVFGNLPFIHTSGMFAFNNLGLELGPAKIGMNNWIAMLNISADAKFLVGLGAFLGLGIEGSSLDLELDMSDVPYFNGDKLKMKIKGDNFFRVQTGVRISLAVFDIWGQANFGSVSSYLVGIGLGLNGL